MRIGLKPVALASERTLRDLGIQMVDDEGNIIYQYSKEGVVLSVKKVVNSKTEVELTELDKLKVGQVYDIYTENVNIKDRSRRDPVLIPIISDDVRKLFKSVDCPAAIAKGFDGTLRVRVIPLQELDSTMLFDTVLAHLIIID